MLAEPFPKDGHTPKLRTACENCRQSKVKCNLSGKNMCMRCLRHGLQCRYGYANRSGKPKGSKNRATLRKMGLSDGWGGNNGKGAFIVDRKCHQDSGDMDYGEKCIGDETLESSQSRLSESPHSFQGTMTADTPLSTEPSSLGSMDQYPSPGLGYSDSTTSALFTAKETAADKQMAELPLSVRKPYTLQPTCDCAAMQTYQMNQLNRLATGTPSLRFDESLQNIKTALTTTQTFLQCATCQKDSAGLVLCMSVLDLALQHLDHWIGCKPDEVIRYGQYEPDAEESRQSRRIGNFVVRGLLLQCREVLGVMRETVEVCGTKEYSYSYSYSYPSLAGEGLMDAMSGEYLRQIIQGHETTVEGCLQAVAVELAGYVVDS